MIHVYYTCKQCDEEMEVGVVINEEDDLPETCPECKAVIPLEAHGYVQTAALEKVMDNADRWAD